MLAGHDTTANTITFLLWELAKQPHYQRRLREEIAAVRAEVTSRGDTEFSVADLEGMKFLQAAMKVRFPSIAILLFMCLQLISHCFVGQEALRVHPNISNLLRTAGQDDVIPLAFPITTKSGEQISSIPISKGQSIIIPISAYNR